MIPTRNRGQRLGDAITGALGQVGIGVEVIVIDDGSEDDTSATLERMADGRLRVLRNDVTRGVAAARNRGIAEAEGDWVAFLDDDDLWAPNKLRAQVEAARSSGASWVYTAAAILDDRRRPVALEPAPDPTEVGRLLFGGSVVPGGCSSVMARTRLLGQVGGFDEDLAVLADWDLWIRLAASAPAAACSEVLVGYVEHPGNMHVRELDRASREFEELALKHRTAARAPKGGFDGLAFARWSASTHLRAGRRQAAALAYLKGGVQHRNIGNLAFALAALGGERAVRRVSRRRGGLEVPDIPWLDFYSPS